MPRRVSAPSVPVSRRATLPTVKASTLFSPTSSQLNGKRVILDKSLRFAFTSTHGEFSVTREGGNKRGDLALAMRDEYSLMHRTGAFEENLAVALPRNLKRGDVFILQGRGGAKFELEVGLDVAKWRAEQARPRRGGGGAGAGGVDSGAGAGTRGVGGSGSDALPGRSGRGRGVGGRGSGGGSGGWGGGGRPS